MPQHLWCNLVAPPPTLPVPPTLHPSVSQVGCQAGGAGAVGMKSVESSSTDTNDSGSADLPAVQPEAAPEGLDEYGWPAASPSAAPAELPATEQIAASGAPAGAPAAFAAALLGALALALLL